MTKQTKLRLVRWVAIPLFVIGLRFVDGGRAWNYMMNHLVLTALLPIVVMFLVLVARGFYMQHRQHDGDGSKFGGAHGAKP
jgi:RsiW-degrading membrane proteinase PrsW (M82 family)